MNKIFQHIQRAVERAAERPASHAKSIPVLEVFQGQTMWEAVVQTFTITGHPKAKRTAIPSGAQ
jgi:hypothetical protein